MPDVVLANVFTDPCECDASDPDGYRSGRFQPASVEGGNALAVKVFELPPGQAICPYHYEYEEEWLIVLEGSVTLRTPAGEEQLERGAIVAFPPGPQGAHKVTNDRGRDQTARVVMFSSSREPAVAVYPDSDKLGVWPGDPADQLMFHRRDGGVEYFDGEPPASVGD